MHNLLEILLKAIKNYFIKEGLNLQQRYGIIKITADLTKKRENFIKVFLSPLFYKEVFVLKLITNNVK